MAISTSSCLRGNGLASSLPIAIIGAEGSGAHTAIEWTNMRCLDEYADLLERFILDAPAS